MGVDKEYLIELAICVVVLGASTLIYHWFPLARAGAGIVAILTVFYILRVWRILPSYKKWVNAELFLKTKRIMAKNIARSTSSLNAPYAATRSPHPSFELVNFPQRDNSQYSFKPSFELVNPFSKMIYQNSFPPAFDPRNFLQKGNSQDNFQPSFELVNPFSKMIYQNSFPPSFDPYNFLSKSNPYFSFPPALPMPFFLAQTNHGIICLLGDGENGSSAGLGRNFDVYPPYLAQCPLPSQFLSFTGARTEEPVCAAAQSAPAGVIPTRQHSFSTRKNEPYPLTS
ncbi:unnamed protein product [Phytomonas sp. Hart1]|nr:unnamed protein product [Phytomonas sp. Hart1]|eukprot:CCW67499.1 unnamed protein product [Phytomonas sp. isolate Hart1]